MKKFFAVFVFFALLPATAKAADVVPASSQQMQLSFAPLVKKTGPAVVNIYAKRVVQERLRAISPFFNDPFFNQFFGGALGQGGFGGQSRERIQKSLGSGVIVGEGGVVATNYHVIKDATEISVALHDGREFAATKLLEDPRTDLAILKIDPKGEKLAVLEFADSDAVDVGDLVLAIGNPFGVGQTVTSGIVSAVARTDVGITDYSFFIQTDAAINPGNSGGALVDMQGRLIGINSAIYSKDGGSLGIGFAVPANMVKTVAEAAQHGSKIQRPWTGMIGQSITSDMLQSLNLKSVQGSLTSKVVKGSPADKAGIKPGDVILSINGKAVQDPAALKFRLATVALGSTINLQVSRAGKVFETSMAAEAAPENPLREETLAEGRNPFAGALVANLSPALGEEIGGLSGETGVVITGVKGGLAARLGFQRGDIILTVNGEKIASVSQFKKILAGGRQQGWQIELQRGGEVINLKVGG